MPAAVVERRILGHGGKNWITATPGPGSTVGGEGALPKFIAFVASGILKGGNATSVGSAISKAVAVMKIWAAGGGHVTKVTQARAAEALAEWEAKRASAAAKRGAKTAVNASNGGAVTQLNFADTEPDADDMMSHVRASVPKGHGMKVPDGTEPAKVAKMHAYLHRQGNAKHDHSNGSMNYSLDRRGFDVALAEARRDALEFAKQSNAGTVKGVAGTSPGARKKASSKGQAMPDGSFPVSNRNLYDRARKALGRTNPAKRAKVKAFLTRVAKKKGWPPPGGDTNMSSLAHDGLVRSLQLANLPHAQFPRVQTNPRPSTGVRHTLSSQRQPTTTTGKAGNEMFPPRARKGGGPGNSLAPYRQPKGASPPPGGPQAPLRLPKGSGSMQIYTPANPAEHSHVMKALRGARALRRQGRTAQANSVMAGLVRQVTGRARKMPNGQTRAHTIREVTTGLAQMAKGTQGITTSGPTGVKKGR